MRVSSSFKVEVDDTSVHFGKQNSKNEANSDICNASRYRTRKENRGKQNHDNTNDKLATVIPNGDVFLSTTRRYTAITSASPFRMGFTNAGYNHGSRYERVPPRAQDYWKKLQQSDVITFLRLIPPFPPPQPPFHTVF